MQIPLKANKVYFFEIKHDLEGGGSSGGTTTPSGTTTGGGWYQQQSRLHI